MSTERKVVRRQIVTRTQLEAHVAQLERELRITTLRLMYAVRVLATLAAPDGTVRGSIEAAATLVEGVRVDVEGDTVVWTFPKTVRPDPAPAPRRPWFARALLALRRRTAGEAC